jgi:hypothetical protein
VDLSAVIFVLLAVAWAVYLIPKALRHGDGSISTRSTDTSSGSTRAVARRDPGRSVEPERSVSRSTKPVEPPRRVAVSAASRRRRILALLLLCVLATALAAALALMPWWSVAVPGVLTVAFLALCRTQVRRSVRPALVRRPVASPEPAVVEAAPAAEPDKGLDEQLDAALADQPNAALDVPFDAEALDAEAFDGEDLEELAQPAYDDTGSIWDPVPVTLPTYVTAPKAQRTVRTIDLGEPGTWTSGRTAEDAEIAVQAAQPEASDGTGRRAVGS